MATIYVNFSDDSKTEIVGYFNTRQDTEVWPHSDEIGADDPRWETYYTAQSPDIQRYLPNPTA